MNPKEPEAEEPGNTMSAPGAGAGWQSYPERHLDELDANLRAFGPAADYPEIKAFVAMMARVAPDADAAAAGRAVIAAAREAARDVHSLAALRKKARSQIDFAIRHASSPDGHLGLPRIVMIAERAGVDPAIARATEEAFLLPRDDPSRVRALVLALRELHNALAAPGMVQTHARRFAQRVATVFSNSTGRKPTVTVNPITHVTSGAWVEFVVTAAVLAGIRAQASEISNAARTVANPMKKNKKSCAN